MAQQTQPDKLWLVTPLQEVCYLDDEGQKWTAPNYLSLDVIHKLEEQYLLIDHADMYEHYLWNICNKDSMRRGSRATARQRILAFLMTFRNIKPYII
jgi:hypothetical protein